MAVTDQLSDNKGGPRTGMTEAQVAASIMRAAGLARPDWKVTGPQRGGLGQDLFYVAWPDDPDGVEMYGPFHDRATAERVRDALNVTPQAPGPQAGKFGPSSLHDLIVEYGNRMLVLGESPRDAEYETLAANAEETLRDIEQALRGLALGPPKNWPQR